MQLHEFTCIFHRTDTKTRTAALRCAGFCNLLFSRILYHEARSAVLLGLIEHAVGFGEQVLDLLRENKAVRADAAADRDLLENTGNIVQELRGERIDIVVWSPEIATYARNALAPAIISRIVVDESENLLEVTVPDDQLTNAIGRKGQNVKLAAKLLGWKIDIFTESRYNEANAIGRGLEQVASVAEIPVEQFVEAGYNTLDTLRAAGDEELADKLTLSQGRIADLRAAINFLSPVVEGTNEDKPSETTEAGDSAAPDRAGEAQ